MAASPSAEPPKKRSSSILGTLRAAVNKVRFLLSSTATRWMVLSSIARGGAAAGAAAPRRVISFNPPRNPSLLDAAEGGFAPSPASSTSTRTSRSASLGTATSRSVSRTSSSGASTAAASPEILTRTSSGGSASPQGDEDIDRRAEQFIANFYRQLRMERQVSLQLRYVRGNSLERTP